MIFPHARYNEILNETFKKITELSELKGGEYAGDEDRLANFRRNGDQVGVIQEQCWAVYYNKHHDAVMQYIKDRAKGKSRTRLEGISGRIDDMIVYLVLFKCFVEEHENNTPAKASARVLEAARDGLLKPPSSRYIA